MPEWEPMAGSIVSESSDDDVWIAVAPAHRPDGKPMKLKAEFRRRRVTQAEALSPTRVVWWFEYPDAPVSAPRMLAVELASTEGGTFITLTSTWRRRAVWRQVVGLPLRPLQRYLVWLTLSHAAGAIGRVFR